jgi:hemerythrin superfamily protein
MNATEVIKRDHEAAKDLFEAYKNASKEDRKPMEEKIFDALDAHEKMEDAHFYPALRGAVEDDTELSDIESEQAELAAQVEEVRSMAGDRDERIKEMMDAVLAHAEKEEDDIFPMAEDVLSAEELENLGEQMEPDSAVAKSEEA